MSGSSLHVPRDVDGDLESLVAQLSEGTVEERGQAAEKLFNKAAEDEETRQKAAAVGVIQPLVHMQTFASGSIPYQYKLTTNSQQSTRTMPGQGTCCQSYTMCTDSCLYTSC